VPAFLDDARAELQAARCATMEALDAVRERRCSVIRYEPDILGRGLDVIFCGLNPAASAARAGHNFSSRSNRFWMVLHLAGFTDIRLQPEDEHRLLEYGCGITTVVGPADQASG
jgi:double-stranded uracil-DNA glycosylase